MTNEKVVLVKVKEGVHRRLKIYQAVNGMKSLSEAIFSLLELQESSKELGDDNR